MTARIVRWSLALVVIVILLAFVDLGTIARRLAAADLRLAVPAMAGLVLVHVVAAVAWRRLLRDMVGITLEWASTLRLYYAAQALGTVTPANLGADVYRVLALGEGTSRARLAKPVLVQRLTSIVALVCLGIAGAAVLPIPGLGPYIVAAAIVGTVLAVVALAITRPSWRLAWLDRLTRRLGWEGDASGRAGLRGAIRDGLGLGLVFHAASLGLGLVLVRAVDPAATSQPWLVLAALAVARLSLAVPLSPNGIGLQEGLLAILFLQLGLPADAAVAAALLNRVAFLATAGVGALSLVAVAHDRRVMLARGSPPPARS